MPFAAKALLEIVGWPAQVPDHQAAALASCIAVAMLAIVLVIAHAEARRGSDGLALIAAWVEVGAWVRFAVCPHCLVHTLFV